MIINAAISNQIKAISFVAMILVVFIHSYNLDLLYGDNLIVQARFPEYFIQNFISNGIARVAVPIFYLISGILFFKDFDLTRGIILSKYRSRFRSIVIPYIGWSAWGIVVFWLLQTIPYSKSFFSGHIIADYSIQEVLVVLLFDPLNYQLWFLRDLIVFVLLSPLIYLFVRATGRVGVVCMLALWFFRYEFRPLDRDLEALTFFTMGCLFSRFKSFFEVTRVGNNRTVYLLLVTWVFLAIVRFVVDYYFDPHPLLRYFLASSNILVGIITFWSSYTILPEYVVHKYILKYAGASFFIYCFHEPVLTIIKKGLFFLLSPSSSLIVYFLSFIITLAISFIGAYILRNYMQKFFTVITGGRQ